MSFAIVVTRRKASSLERTSHPLSIDSAKLQEEMEMTEVELQNLRAYQDEVG